VKHGVALVLCGVLIFGIEKSGGINLRAGIERVMLPFILSSGRFRSTMTTPFLFIDVVRHAEQENQELRAERARLISALEEMKMSKSLVHERMINMPANNTSYIQTFFIDANTPMIPIGERQGVRSGAMILKEGVFVGLVTQASVQFSHVETLSNISKKLSVRVRETQTEGLLERGKEGLMLTHIRPDAILTIGHTITTFGSDEGILPYIPLGRVSRIISSPSDPFQRTIIDPLIMVRDGDAVSVLQNGAP